MNKKEFISAFREARLYVYLSIVIVGSIIYFFDPFDYLCNYAGYSCPFCGLKTAIYYSLRLNFKAAYNSNHGIVLVAILAILSVIDLIHIKKSKSTK